jgi:hypothetical protein
MKQSNRFQLWKLLGGTSMQPNLPGFLSMPSESPTEFSRQTRQFLRREKTKIRVQILGNLGLFLPSQLERCLERGLVLMIRLNVDG